MNYSIFDLDYDRNIIRAGAYPEENLETKNAFTEGVAPGLVGPIGGKYLPDIGELAWLNESDIEIEDIINDRIDTQQAYIKSNWTFTESGAFVVKTDDDNGMWFSPTGILAKKSGKTTLAITNGGSATFAGTLSAATGTLGEITLASGGNIKLGQTAYKTGTGFWLGDDSDTTKLSIGSSTKNITWDGSNLSVVGGTITGGIIQTASSDQRVIISGSDNTLRFYNSDGDQVIGIGSTSSTAIKIDPNETTGIGVNIEAEKNITAIKYTNTENVANRFIDVDLGYGSGNTSNNVETIRVQTGGASEILYGRIGGTGRGILLNRDVGSGSAALLDLQSTNAAGGVMLDIQRGGITTGSITGIRLTHSTGSSSQNVGIEINQSSGDSSACYVLKIVGQGAVTSAVSGTQSAKLRIQVGSTTYYIPLYTA